MNVEDKPLNQLLEDYDKHTFREIEKKRQNIKFSLKTLEENFKKLKKFIDKYIKSRDYFFTDEVRDNVTIREELYRLNHNYLCSYYTQYQMSITFRDSLLDNNVYNELIEEHNIRPTSDFLNKLRNHMQHVSSIKQNTRSSWNPESGREPLKLIIDIDGLLDEVKLNNNAEEFIEKKGDNIRLIDIAESHHQNIMAFHDELWDKTLELYEDEFNELRKIENEIDQKLSEN